VIPRFAFRRPLSLAEAFDAFANGPGDATWIAGGTELLQVMKMGLAEYDTLIDLKGIDELRGIREEADGSTIIGALTTHREVERSGLVRRQVPALSSLARNVANVRVRATGTLGGNLCFAEPHSDPATLLLACDATVELAGPGGRRSMPVGAFVVGPLVTAREASEIVTSVRIPLSGPGEGLAYQRIAFFERPAASVAVRVLVVSNVIRSATVAVGSMTEIPTIVQAAGDALLGAPADPDGLGGHLAAATGALAAIDAVPDLNGSADYKRHLAGVLLGRALPDALEAAVAGA
jgi:aerobic carbon-monoxide dehydrogenase medium subunit